MNTASVYQMISQLFPQECTNYCCALCGSALEKAKPRDVDLMIFVDDQTEDWISTLTANLSTQKIEWSRRYISELKLKSVKFRFQGSKYSLHITEKRKIDKDLARIKQVSTYKEVNLFGFERNLSTIYRCWILESVFLYGNYDMLSEFQRKISSSKVPFKKLKAEFSRRITETYKYLHEKEINQNPMFSGVSLMRIFSLAVQYCYAANHQFFGTLKYLEKDLHSFHKDSEIVKTTIFMFESFEARDMGRSAIAAEKLVQLLTKINQINKEK